MSNYPQQEPSLYTQVDSFGGLNWLVNASRIDDNQATIMENFIINESGILTKRTGLIDVSKVDTAAIYNMISYKNNIYYISASGVYMYNTTTKITTTVLKESCSNLSNFFILNTLLFILNGTFIYTYDGTTLKKLQDDAYVPTLFISSSPSGAGTQYEQFNCLSKSFKQKFSSDGTSRDYKLCIPLIETETIVVQIVKDENILTLTRDTDYKYLWNNSLKTVIQFTTAPEKGVDNIIITAKLHTTNKLYPKYLENLDRINKSSIYSFYGGQNDTRLLLAGQDSVFYRSDVYNPYYFPENYYQSVGDTDEKITGFATQYDYCVILKERSLWNTRFELSQFGTPVYTTKPLNSQIGCINPKTIQLVENSPVFISKKGITVINQTQVKDERNISIISEPINKSSEIGYAGLLNEDLTNGASIDIDSKYIYGINNKCYVYDYKNKAFYIWRLPENVIVTSFCELNGVLYIGTSYGFVFRFRTSADTGNLYDDKRIFNNGTTYVTEDYPVNCLWKSKLFAFNNYTKYKLIENLFLSISPSEQTSVTVKYVTDNNTVIDVGTTSNNLMNYLNTNYGTFSYTSTYFPVIDNLKIRAKKILFFQVVFENNNPVESLDIFSLGIKFKYQREVKP